MLVFWRIHLTLVILLLLSSSTVFAINSPRKNVTVLLLAPKYGLMNHEVVSPLELVQAAFDVAIKHPLLQAALGNTIELVPEAEDFPCDHVLSIRELMSLKCKQHSAVSSKQFRLITGLLCSYPINNVFQFYKHKSDAFISAGALSDSLKHYNDLIRVGATGQGLYKTLTWVMSNVGHSWNRLFFINKGKTVPSKSGPSYHVDMFQCQFVDRAFQHYFKANFSYHFEAITLDSQVAEDMKMNNTDGLYTKILLERIGNKFAG